MDETRQRWLVLVVLLGLLVVLLVADAWDCMRGAGNYDVPPLLPQLLGIAVGWLFAADAVRRWKNGNGNGNGKPNGKSGGEGK